MNSILYDKGEIKGFPICIVDLMLEYQEEQCGFKDVKIFEADKCADKESNGFDWFETPEGMEFWENVIRKRMFQIFFDKYPHKMTLELDEFLNSRNFGQIEDLPKEVLGVMLQRQKDAGNPENLSVFETDKHANSSDGGFNWSDTPEGYDFWEDVLDDFNYCRFFGKYLKSKPSYSEKIECKVEKWTVLHTIKPFKENYFSFENLFD